MKKKIVLKLKTDSILLLLVFFFSFFFLLLLPLETVTSFFFFYEINHLVLIDFDSRVVCHDGLLTVYLFRMFTVISPFHFVYQWLFPPPPPPPPFLLEWLFIYYSYHPIFVCYYFPFMIFFPSLFSYSLSLSLSLSRMNTCRNCCFVLFCLFHFFSFGLYDIIYCDLLLHVVCSRKRNGWPRLILTMIEWRFEWNWLLDGCAGGWELVKTMDW